MKKKRNQMTKEFKAGMRCENQFPLIFFITHFLIFLIKQYLILEVSFKTYFHKAYFLFGKDSDESDF